MGIAGACLLAIVASASNGVQVRQEPYRHWPDAWRISNGRFEVVVVPTVGRIMRYGRIGGRNALWEGGNPPPDQYGWPNHGGEKLWIAPQSAWGWPPPTSFDPGTWVVTPIDGGLSIELTSFVDPGIAVERTIRLAPGGSSATIESTVVNRSAQTLERSAWHIAQVPPQGPVVAPLRPTPTFPEGFAFYPEFPASARTSVQPQGDSLHVSNRADVGFKLGLPAQVARIEHRAPGQTFSIAAQLPPDSRYPDGGKAWQVASVAKKSRYLEMETCGPLTALAPGESTRLLTVWELTQGR